MRYITNATRPRGARGMDDPDGILYRLALCAEVPDDAWRARLQYTGVYKGVAGLDGNFIHCSTPEQAAQTAAAHFAGKDDVMLLRFSVSLMREADLEVRWEDAAPAPGTDQRDGKFPHVYGGPIPYACLAAPPVVLALGSDGKHTFPSASPTQGSGITFAPINDEDGFTEQELQDDIEGIEWNNDVDGMELAMEENAAQEWDEYEDNPLDEDDDC